MPRLVHVMIFGASIAGCAGSKTSAPPGPISAAEVATAMKRPREHRGCAKDTRCALDEPLFLTPAPVRDDAQQRTTPSASRLPEALGAAALVASVAGAGVCWFECPEPWDSAVPIGIGSAAVVGLIVAFAVIAPSIGATK